MKFAQRFLARLAACLHTPHRYADFPVLDGKQLSDLRAWAKQPETALAIRALAARRETVLPIGLTGAERDEARRLHQLQGYSLCLREISRFAEDLKKPVPEETWGRA